MVDQNVHTYGVKLNIALKIVSGTHKGFQLCPLNAHSFSKLNAGYFNYLLHSLAFDVVCIIETWSKLNVYKKLVISMLFAMTGLIQREAVALSCLYQSGFQV